MNFRCKQEGVGRFIYTECQGKTVKNSWQLLQITGPHSKIGSMHKGCVTMSKPEWGPWQDTCLSEKQTKEDGLAFDVTPRSKT